ncbi:MAG: hypothetical protein GY755_10615, partial [Chloroflexi bacterium]|nr:hypothetical protein [Chloroflexota bacterium]
NFDWFETQSNKLKVTGVTKLQGIFFGVIDVGGGFEVKVCGEMLMCYFIFLFLLGEKTPKNKNMKKK